MSIDVSTPWHRESFDRLIDDRLPALLADRLPLAGYHAEATGETACRITVTISTGSESVAAVYDLPRPDEQGLFHVNDRRYVVVPTASSADLDQAEVRCAGELLYDVVAAQLGEASDGLPWDEELLRTWLPLDSWVRDFVSNSQVLDDTNWLARHTHLRRISIPNADRVMAPGQIGRTCPLETPENEHMGKVLTVAVGAAIRGGRLVILDDRPEAGLGLTASMIPFTENSEPTRRLMACNQIRQCLPSPAPEPAIVQTGNEPAAPDFWWGCNLLTAFVPWGFETFEDAIAISESAAKRLNWPVPIEAGDKLCTRYGNKGVVSRILPDSEMPHLPDGTPVEACQSFFGIPSRLGIGQIREAVLSRIAQVHGSQAIVPPFHAPKPDELRARLRKAGLPEDGLEQLTLGRNGPALGRRSTVGWVYWGRMAHTAAKQIHTWMENDRAQKQCDLEYFVLRDAGAYELVREQYHTRAATRRKGGPIAASAAEGPVVPAPAPSPRFARLVRRLAAAGIRAELDDGRIRFSLAVPEDGYRLARPVPHPWLPDHMMAAVGRGGKPSLFDAARRANEKLERLLEGRAPEGLVQRAAAELAHRARRYVGSLVRTDDVRPDAHVLFSARAVIVPDGSLRYDQIGLPDEIAWALFGPLAAHETGLESVENRTGPAAAVLDSLMARSWVLVNRPPSVMSTSVLAFRPICVAGRAIHVHHAACAPLNADFDGDIVSVFLPITEAGQQEAAEKLSLAGHLGRDPELLGTVITRHDSLWGIAQLSRTLEGLNDVAEILGEPVAAPEGYATRQTIRDAAAQVLAREGADAILARLDLLAERGFEVARRSGATVSPFTGCSAVLPPAPETDEPRAWLRYSEMLTERLSASNDFDDPEIGALLLSIKCGARAIMKHAVWHVGSPGTATDVFGREVPIRHGLCEGITPEEFTVLVAGMREGLARWLTEWIQSMEGYRDGRRTKAFTTLSRAMRARNPGIVFAHAAAVQETDPLFDLDSRLFVGLPAD